MYKRIRFLVLAGMGMVFLLMTGCYTSFAMTVRQPVTRTTYILEDFEEDEYTGTVVYDVWYEYIPVYTPVPIMMPVYYDPWVTVHGWQIGWNPYFICFDNYYWHPYAWPNRPWPSYYGGYHHGHDWHTPYYAVWARDDHWQQGHKTMVERSFERRHQSLPVTGRTGTPGKLAENTDSRKPRPQQRTQSGSLARNKTITIPTPQADKDKKSVRTGNATIGRRETQSPASRNNQNAGEKVKPSASPARRSSGAVEMEVNIRPETKRIAEPVLKRSNSAESTRRNTPSAKRPVTAPAVSQKSQERNVTNTSTTSVRKSNQNESTVKRPQESVRASRQSSDRPERSVQPSVQPSPGQSSRVSAPSRTSDSPARSASGRSGSSNSGSKSGNQSSGRKRN